MFLVTTPARAHAFVHIFSLCTAEGVGKGWQFRTITAAEAPGSETRTKLLQIVQNQTSEVGLPTYCLYSAVCPDVRFATVSLA